MTADDVQLIVEQADGSYRTTRYAGVPATRASTIALVSVGSAQSKASVSALAGELDAALLGAAPMVVATPVTPAISPGGIDVAADPSSVKLLVLVGDGRTPLQNSSWYSDWCDDHFSAAVMILLPPGDYDTNFAPGLGDDHPLRRTNAMHWRVRIDEALPTLLARAEITALESRVFISYRRVETLPLALQLFDRLSEERFNVFLDRFTIPPGYDFQRRLNQELADKSMVLLLESALLGDSKWTQHEIDFAKRNRLGLLALSMPDVTLAHWLPSISDVARRPLTREDFTGPPEDCHVNGGGTVKQWPRLTNDALDDAVAVVKEAHAEALFRRRHRLRLDLVTVLSQEPGVRAAYSAVGPLKVAFGGDDHLLWPVTRPPAVADFRSLHDAILKDNGRSGRSRAIIIGPRAALEPDRNAELQWLSNVSTCLCYDEGDLPGFARRLVTETWG